MDCGTHAWSTDSQLIAYGCWGQDKAVIYVTGPAETGSSRLLLESPEELGSEVRGFTADNSHVLVGQFGPEGKREFISVAVDGDDPSSNFERVTMDDEPSNWPLPTHDGRWMLYFSRDTGRRELYIREIVDDHSVGPRSSLGLEADLAWWSHVHGNGTYSGSDDFYMGLGQTLNAVTTRAPTVQQITRQVLPALKQTLDGTNNRDIVGAVMVAMAKIGRDHPDFDILEIMAARLHSGDQEIRETAEADVMHAGVDAECLEGFQIDLLNVQRSGFENDLKLVVLVQPHRIVAVTPIDRPSRRLAVRDPPGLGTEHAKEGVGVHRPRADLDVVGLLQHATLLAPEALNRKQQVLERHERSSAPPANMWT